MLDGVATSLSCVESNTGSSEDAVVTITLNSSNVSEDQQLIPKLSRMPPQTQHVNNNQTNPSATSETASNSTATTTTTHSTAACLTVSNTNNSNNSNSNTTTAKLRTNPIATTMQQMQGKTSNNTAIVPCNTTLAATKTTQATQIPSLQWPWTVTQNTAPPAAAPSLHSTVSSSTSSPTVASTAQNGKKRNAANTPECAAKKSRSAPSQDASQNTAQLNNSNVGSAAQISKRLKAAALEESQTKITGYFKSQMKAQIHQNGISGKRSDSAMPNPLTMCAPSTTASLNKYFNILSQLKEKENDNQAKTSATTPTVVPKITSATIAKAVSATTASPSTPMLPPPASIPMPALKKIERSKPTKIAQVAPNLRKQPPNGGNYNSISGTGKSPAKKHVAIAPRTPEMKQQQQNIAPKSTINSSEVTNKNMPSPSSATTTNQTTTTSTQPAVLLTTIPQLKTAQASQKLATTTTTANGVNVTTTATPAHNTTLYQLPTAVQLPNLVQLPQLLAANAQAQAAQAAAQYFLNGTVFRLQQFTTATTTTASSGPTPCANPFNFMSANEFQELLLKQQQHSTTQQTSIEATSTTTPSQQQLLPDHILLQQQLNSAPKKTASVGVAVASQSTLPQQTKVTTPQSFQDIFQQQIAAAFAASQQQQQQFHQLQRLGAAAANMQQQPVLMATPAGLLLNTVTLPAMLAQAAAALAVNNNQQQQKAVSTTSLHQPQLPALQPISSIFTSNNQQQQDAHDLHQQQFQQQQLAHLALAQQQFITTATQPPPLSAVTVNNTSSNNNCNNNNNIKNTANNLNSNSLNNSNNSGVTPITGVPQNTSGKLAIVKATSAPILAARNNSQPPPLVTISKTKTTVLNANPKTSVMQQKAAGSTGASHTKTHYNKRIQKATPPPAKLLPSRNKQAKVTTANGKIIATPTTPPPLVPALPIKATPSTKFNSLKDLSQKSSPAINNNSSTVKLVPLPTPALVSIAPTPSAIAAKTTKSVATCRSLPSTSITTTKPTSVSSSLIITNPISLKPVKPKPVTPDLFDLIKNSNGAISITSKSNSSVIATGSASLTNFEKALQTDASPSLSSVSIANFNNIKDEPLESPINQHQISAIKLEKSTMVTRINRNNNSCFTNSKSTLSNDIKMELMDDSSTKMSNALHRENSYSCFSSHSNSVSSAADLSLEASTPPSLTISSPSLSPAGSAATSPSRKLHHNHHRRQNDQSELISSNSNLFVDSGANSSHASNQDMLSELVTSSCISSDYCSKGIKPNSDDEEKDIIEETDVVKRDLPTPADSAIGGSLSTTNSESSISVVSTKKFSSKKCESQIESPPPTPNASNSNSCSNSDNNSIDSSVLSPISHLITDNANSLSTYSLNVSSLSTPDTSDSSNHLIIETPQDLSYCSSPTTLSNVLLACTAIKVEVSSTDCNTDSSADTNQSITALFASTSNSTSNDTVPTNFINTQLTETAVAQLPKSAISPILSQPKMIRFPADSARNTKRHDGVCYWYKCNQKHDSSSKLLDHMQTYHVNTQTGPFSCLWVGCKVYNKESCSRRWLERHVLSHGGSKQFKCIVEGCGLRFASQLALQKHVNNHFTATENKESNSKRTSDPPVPKQLRKNGKKLRYRRQPFSARMFDFFDIGIMEGLQHRLRQISALTNGANSITFIGECMMRRRTMTGVVECYITWSPRDIIANEWLPQRDDPYVKEMNIKRMTPAEKTKVETLLMASYKMPHSPNLFNEDVNDEEEDDENESENYEEENSDNEVEEISETNEDEKLKELTLTASIEPTIGFEVCKEIVKKKEIFNSEIKEMYFNNFMSFTNSNVLTVAKIESQPRRKHLRKPQKEVGTLAH